MRRFAFSNKKLRGIPRRLRALTRWVRAHKAYFPEISARDFTYGYWNYKIPVHLSLVEGKQTNAPLRAFCAQSLVDAAYHIYKAKPDDADDIRVTCCIVQPGMFSSELCLFTAEEYFDMHTQEGNNRFGQLSVLENRSLVREWGLTLPEEFSETGILRTEENEDGEVFHSEHWYIGEVAKK